MSRKAALASGFPEDSIEEQTSVLKLEGQRASHDQEVCFRTKGPDRRADSTRPVQLKPLGVGSWEKGEEAVRERARALQEVVPSSKYNG